MPFLSAISQQHTFIDFIREVAQHPFRLHLRRLSDGEPHPMATRPIIPIKMTTSDPSECVFDVQLQETFVGVLIRQQADILDDYDHLAVWNWQTGDSQLVSFRILSFKLSFLTWMM